MGIPISGEGKRCHPTEQTIQKISIVRKTGYLSNQRIPSRPHPSIPHIPPHTITSMSSLPESDSPYTGSAIPDETAPTSSENPKHGHDHHHHGLLDHVKHLVGGHHEPHTREEQERRDAELAKKLQKEEDKEARPTLGDKDEVGFSYKGSNKPTPGGFDYSDDVEAGKKGGSDSFVYLLDLLDIVLTDRWAGYFFRRPGIP